MFSISWFVLISPQHSSELPLEIEGGVSCTPELLSVSHLDVHITTPLSQSRQGFTSGAMEFTHINVSVSSVQTSLQAFYLFIQFIFAIDASPADCRRTRAVPDTIPRETK